MDIERELEKVIEKYKGKPVATFETRIDLLAEDCLKEIRRLKAEIARQSVKSEDVQEAITQLEIMATNMMGDILNGNPLAEMKIKAIDLAITALQAYQPTTRKDRTVEEVAISKTETPSCKWCDNADEMEVAVKTVFSSGRSVGIKRFSSSKSTFCPNCGRRLD